MVHSHLRFPWVLGEPFFAGSPGSKSREDVPIILITDTESVKFLRPVSWVYETVPGIWGEQSCFLGGGNSNIFGMFTPNLGEMIQFWLAHIFQMGWFNHQLGKYIIPYMEHLGVGSLKREVRSPESDLVTWSLGMVVLLEIFGSRRLMEAENHALEWSTDRPIKCELPASRKKPSLCPNNLTSLSDFDDLLSKIRTCFQGDLFLALILTINLRRAMKNFEFQPTRKILE